MKLNPKDKQNWKYEGRKLIKQYRAKKKARQLKNEQETKQIKLKLGDTYLAPPLADLLTGWPQPNAFVKDRQRTN